MLDTETVYAGRFITVRNLSSVPLNVSFVIARRLDEATCVKTGGGYYIYNSVRFANIPNSLPPTGKRRDGLVWCDDV